MRRIVMLLNDEIDKLYEQARNYYTNYFFNWIDMNFNYGSIRIPFFHEGRINSDLLDPNNLLNNLIKKESNSKEYNYQNEEKRLFFEKLQSKVYKEIEQELNVFDSRFLYFLYGLIAQNRELSIQIVTLQKDINMKTIDSEIYNFLRLVMTDAYDSLIIKESAEEIEGFISTQEEAIESLIYIWNKLKPCQDNKNFNSNEYQNINYSSPKYQGIIKKVLSLSHVFILLHNSRKIYCSGKNYENTLYILKDGTYYCEDKLEYEKTTCTNYNYVFNRDWMEYKNGMSEKMKYFFKRKYGFDLDLLYAIKQMIIKYPQNVLHFKNKEEVEKIFNNIFTVNVFNSLFPVFTYKQPKKSYNLFVNLIPENEKFHNKVLVENDGRYIIYKQIAWQALERYRCDVHINPHRYFDDSFVRKLTQNFERTLAEKLVDEFPGSHAITGIELNKFGGTRQLDIIFVLGLNIYIIECKKIKMSESIPEILNNASRLRGKYAKQLNEEIKQYTLYKQELLTMYSNDLGIDINNLNKYKDGYYMVTTETTLAHRDKDRHIFIVQDFIDYIRIESMK